MELTTANLDAMFTGYSAAFAAAYQSAPVWHQKLAMLPTYGNVEAVVNGWMDQIPQMRQWIGPRHIHNVATRGRSMTALPFEETIAIDKYKLEDDQFGLYTPAVQMLAYQAAKYPDSLLAAKIIENPTCFDGVSFFNDAHPVDVDAGAGGPLGSYDNSLGLALTGTNFGIARATMRGFKGRDGRAMGIRPTTLVVPPSLEDTAQRIMTSDYLASFLMGSTTAGNVAAEPNIYKGACEVLVVDELEVAPTTWYIVDNSKPIKPFLFWQRKAPEMVFLNRPTDPNVFYSRQFLFGVEARGVCDVTLPFLAIKSTP